MSMSSRRAKAAAVASAASVAASLAIGAVAGEPPGSNPAAEQEKRVARPAQIPATILIIARRDPGQVSGQPSAVSAISKAPVAVAPPQPVTRSS